MTEFRDVTISRSPTDKSAWRLQSELWLPEAIETVFDFFADVKNLESITPPWLNFQVVTPGPVEMGNGAVIDYRLRMRGLPLRWRSEISNWSRPHKFTDRQLKGPYRSWVHTHGFQAVDGGTLVTDDVTYRLLCDWLVHKYLVAPDLQRIFEYRCSRLRERFGSKESSGTSTD